jgi:glycosyltransferase involved in cell wall biosynthesis
MAECARESSLFRDKRIEVIPNGFDTSKYKPLDKLDARFAFNFPADKRLVLFSSFSAVADPRKGFQYLIPALQGLSDKKKSQIELVVLGSGKPKEPIEFGMPVHYIEHLHDEISQVMLYSAVDAVVLPSVQENLSNTVIEAMLCGAPVIAFDIGGMPDMIDHQITGYLARPFDPSDLAAGIWTMIADDDAHSRLSEAARKRAVERFGIQDIAGRYRDLYMDVLA